MPPILPFAGAADVPLPIDVQRFDRDHFVRTAGLHGHTFNEIVVFESAGDVHRVGSHERASGAGALDAIGAGQVHEVTLGTAAAGWMVLFPDVAVERAGLPARAIDWFSRRGGDAAGRVSLLPGRFARVDRSIAALADALPHDPRAGAVLFRGLLVELTAGHQRQLPAFAVYGHLERLLETLEDRFREKVTLDDIAGAVGVTKAYLTTELREKTGRTAMQWLLERRMREARRILSATQTPVTQIAHDVGFEDSSHFARRFRDVHGVSPLSWRAGKRADQDRNFVPAARRARGLRWAQHIVVDRERAHENPDEHHVVRAVGLPD